MLNRKTMNTKELAQKIRRLNALYRAGTPEVSDSEYDALIEQLRELEPDADWFASVEPAPVSQGRKRKLPIPMKSLNKVKSLDEVRQWLKSLNIPNDAQLVIMPKFDGVSWLHDEKTGKTYSRGGSENEGQDCTKHFNNGFFHTLWEIGDIAYSFGELVFTTDNWKEHFEGKRSSEGNTYKSPRNTIAGLINRDMPSDEIAHANFIIYGADFDSLKRYTCFSNFLWDVNDATSTGIFNENGEEDSNYKVIVAKHLSEDLLTNLYNTWRKSVYIDGLVIYLNDLHLWESIGRQQTTGNPLYAIAYKHPDFTESFETTVKGIDWKVSKAGALKPVVNIEAVDTGDCTMENPTGYNASWIKNNHIGPGARILVTRSGGVIPKILETLEPVEPDLPKICPNCGGGVIPESTELICVNPDCCGVKLAKIIFFFKTVGAEDIGEEMITKLFNAGYDSIKKILDLTVLEIMAIDGFGDGTADIIRREMRKIKSGIPLTTLMHSSDCFKGIGKVKADKLMANMSKDELRAYVNGNYVFSINEPESITEKSFREGYPQFFKFLQTTGIPPILPIKNSGPSSNRYEGMNVCFSGIRDAELEAAIVDGCGSIASGVSKKTSHLVVKDPNGTSSKISKAKQLGIPILSVEDFKAQF